MSQDIKYFIAACLLCARGKISTEPPTGLLNLLPIPRCPFLLLGFHLLITRPSWPWTTVFLHFIPLPKLPSAVETRDLLVKHVFPASMVSQERGSDWGLQFTSQVWKAFCKVLEGGHSKPLFWMSLIMELFPTMVECAHNYLVSGSTGMSLLMASLGVRSSMSEPHFMSLSKNVCSPAFSPTPMCHWHCLAYTV